MTRLRNHWLALLGGALLLALSVSTALGASPFGDEDGEATNRGQEVSSFVHDLIFGQPDPAQTGDEDPTEEEDTDEEGDEDVADEEDEDTAEEDAAGTEGDEATQADEVVAQQDGEFKNHGQCVRTFAQDKEAVGGPNENHGGAVSEAARVTCWELLDQAPAEPTSEEAAVETTGEATSTEGEEEADTDDSDTDSASARGNSANAHAKNGGGGNNGGGNGWGRGGRH